MPNEIKYHMLNTTCKKINDCWPECAVLTTVPRAQKSGHHWVRLFSGHWSCSWDITLLQHHTSELPRVFSYTLDVAFSQMSCVSSSPLLSDRVRFPRYFQLLSSAKRIAFGYFNIIKEYRWRRVAIIVQDENVFRVVSYTVYSPIAISWSCFVCHCGIVFQPMNLLKTLLRDEHMNYENRFWLYIWGVKTRC